MTRYLQQKTLFPPQIDARIAPNLGIVVVIPCCDEAELLFSLMSLKKCQSPKCSVEVIIVINNSEKASEALKNHNQKTYQETQEWAKKNSRPEFKFHVLFHPDLPHKHAGVGLARKIGMDEAAWRLEKIGNPEGIIVCFDADSKCQHNYFVEIEKHFEAHPKTTACGIHFEHPLSGLDFEEKIYDAITLYELHLRYYVEIQKFTGFPFAFQTIGSSMAARCNAYQKQGGMNKRKAGEDFYFLHKFIELGSFTEIHSTKVIPSPRPSHRVPFGTGKAVGELLKGKMKYFTYTPESFMDLKAFFDALPNFYNETADTFLTNMPVSVAAFLKTVDFDNKWQEHHKNTSDLASFRKRFFRWFNAFMLMKYVHFARDNYYPDVPVEAAASWLLEELELPTTKNARTLLGIYRTL